MGLQTWTAMIGLLPFITSYPTIDDNRGGLSNFSLLMEPNGNDDVMKDTIESNQQ